MEIWARWAVMAGISSLSVLASQPDASKSQQQTVIEANRKGARPRPIAPGLPLSKEERQREQVFQSARKSVVFINAVPPEVLIQNPYTGQLTEPRPGTGTARPRGWPPGARGRRPA